MNKLLSISRLWGPLATISFTVIYHYGMQQGWYEASLSTIFLFVAAGAFVSGIRGGMLAATWGTGYALYIMLPSTRMIQVIAAMYAVALLVGYATRRLRLEIEAKHRAEREAEQNRIKTEMLDSAESILRVFGETIDITGSLRLGWENMLDDTRFLMMERAHGKLASLITLSRGFEEMAKNERLVIGREKLSPETQGES